MWNKHFLYSLKCSVLFYVSTVVKFHFYLHAPGLEGVGGCVCLSQTVPQPLTLLGILDRSVLLSALSIINSSIRLLSKRWPEINSIPELAWVYLERLWLLYEVVQAKNCISLAIFHDFIFFFFLHCKIVWFHTLLSNIWKRKMLYSVITQMFSQCFHSTHTI